MHEAGVAEALVRIVTSEAARHLNEQGQVPKIRQISIVLSESGGFMRESLELYVSVFAKGTAAEKACLNLRYEPTRMSCAACGRDFVRKRFSFDCPVCGKPGTMVRATADFYIESIELEDFPTEARTTGASA